MNTKKQERKFKIHEFFFLLWLILIVCSFLLLDSIPGIVEQTTLVKLFIATNLSSFLLFGFDKLQAITKRKRVPELTLYLSALLGGPIGALVAMYLFRHKTKKLSFQLILAIILLLQIGLVYLLTQ